MLKLLQLILSRYKLRSEGRLSEEKDRRLPLEKFMVPRDGALSCSVCRSAKFQITREPNLGKLLPSNTLKFVLFTRIISKSI